MGKRKKSSRKPTGPKKKEPLATTFQCLFCNHENSVTVKLDKKLGLGHLSCKVCGQSFDSNINYLSAAVDVYSDWVDACDAVAKGGAAERAPGDADTIARPSAPGQRAAAGEERYEGDFVVDDEPDMEDDFGDDDDD